MANKEPFAGKGRSGAGGQRKADIAAKVATYIVSGIIPSVALFVRLPRSLLLMMPST